MHPNCLFKNKEIKDIHILNTVEKKNVQLKFSLCFYCFFVYVAVYVKKLDS